ncbi:MAG: ATP-grasp ribosomal peptide maturase [Pseudonocardia sp.]|jgi:ATP-grasp ribosomal peptide maturase|nr:ATP-grasp ribosomal peptide maturase [Pseudonocardia sp.]
MTVLILARDIDPHIDRVVEELTARDVPVFRTDLTAFPKSLMLDARLREDGWYGELANEYRSVQLSDIGAVWYRHPSHFEFPEDMSSTERRHATAEAKCAFSGTLSRLKALWVNYPSREADAVKPAQLDVARECGLAVPPSLLTNKPQAVRAFAEEIGGPLAVKNLSAAAIAESGGVRVAFTRRLDGSDLDDLRGVETTAHLFQAFIEPKEFEARVTVVGEHVFAAAIHAGSDASKIDFRSDYDNLTYSAVEPPEQIIAGMLAFMRAFGLVFGCFDFAVTPAGEWVMFECNPFGAYGWLEEALGFPISATLAGLLAEGTVHS